MRLNSEMYIQNCCFRVTISSQRSF